MKFNHILIGCFQKTAQKKNSLSEKYYIYIYLDPRKPGIFLYDNLRFDFEPFYVGKGKNNRINEGLSNKRDNKYKLSKIKKIREQNLEVISFKLYENLTESKAYDIEIDIISKIGRKINGGPLCNIHPGGSGGDNISKHPSKEAIIEKWRKTRMFNINNGIVVVSEEKKQKTRDYHLLKKKLGIPYYKPTEEHKRILSEANKGVSKPKTELHKLKLKEANLGKFRTEESKNKQSVTCRETLSNIKDKLKEKSKGIKNSNAKKYLIKNLVTKETIEIYGYNEVMYYYNSNFGTVYKDGGYFIRKLKDDKIKDIKLIDIININYKNN